MVYDLSQERNPGRLEYCLLWLILFTDEAFRDFLPSPRLLVLRNGCDVSSAFLQRSFAFCFPVGIRRVGLLQENAARQTDFNRYFEKVLQQRAGLFEDQ